jgi:hypothetical protein
MVKLVGMSVRAGAVLQSIGTGATEKSRRKIRRLKECCTLLVDLVLDLVVDLSGSSREALRTFVRVFERSPTSNHLVEI